MGGLGDLNHSHPFVQQATWPDEAAGGVLGLDAWSSGVGLKVSASVGAPGESGSLDLRKGTMGHG